MLKKENKGRKMLRTKEDDYVILEGEKQKKNEEIKKMKIAKENNKTHVPWKEKFELEKKEKEKGKEIVKSFAIKKKLNFFHELKKIDRNFAIKKIRKKSPN